MEATKVIRYRCASCDDIMKNDEKYYEKFGNYCYRCILKIGVIIKNKQSMSLSSRKKSDDYKEIVEGLKELRKVALLN